MILLELTVFRYRRLTFQPLRASESARKETPSGSAGGVPGSIDPMRWLKWTTYAIFALLIAVIALILGGNFLSATPRDAPYRNWHPESDICRDQWPDSGATVLYEYDNDEEKVQTKAPSRVGDPTWAQKLGCAWQTHAIPLRSGSGADAPGAKPLKYHLAFLEFKEDGSPQALRYGSPRGGKLQLMKHPAKSRNIVQFDIIEDYLSKRVKQHKSTYVMVFIPGWRHDAGIGDGNVADARHFAAHSARFLAERCEAGELHFCDTEVVAVYVGWRGARVNERLLKSWFGAIGEWIGDWAAFPTLFDRKPVSEQIAAPVLSAMLRITDMLKIHRAVEGDKPTDPPKFTDNRMIVFGHSLGGNLLATALKDHYVKAVERHVPGTYMKPLIGNLVVLINPASEAANWTAIQRAVWNRIAFWNAEEVANSDALAGHTFFNEEQAPIFISVTAARSWPPGGVRPSDCVWLNVEDPNEDSTAKKRVYELILKSGGMFANRVEYDWATFDAFPLFKGDFRPFAQTVDRFAARISEQGEPESACSKGRDHKKWWWSAIAKPFAVFASVLRNTPFMNTDQEQTRTIGHIDPLRPPFGGLINSQTLSFKPFGTTHELHGVQKTGDESPVKYSQIGYDKRAACPAAQNWLWYAKRTRNHYHSGGKEWDHGTYWDSDDLRSLQPSLPAAQFVHGFINGGMAAITRANDPFWNIRAFDNALARHDGYRLSSFICAMNQLVLDQVAFDPARLLPSSTAPRPSDTKLQ